MKRQKSGRGKDGCLRNRKFLCYLVSVMLNRLGDSIDTLAVSWLMFQISGSAALSAVALGVNFLPTLVLQPVAGVLVERMSKRKVLAAADLGRAILVGIMIGGYSGGILRPGALLLLTFSVSVLEAFRNPAAMAVMVQVLSREQYDGGAGICQSASRVMELAGMGAAGIMIAGAGITATLAADGLCFALSAGAAFLTGPVTGSVLGASVQDESSPKEQNQPKPGEAENEETRAEKKQGRKKQDAGRERGAAGPGLKAEILEGIRYMRNSRILTVITAEAIFLNMAVTPVNAVLTPLVREVYGKGSECLSLINGGLSLGMLVGASAYPFLASKIKYNTMFLICGMLNAAVYVSLAAAEAIADQELLFAVSMAAVALLFGTALGVLNTAVAARMMKEIPQGYMARVSAWMNALCTAPIPLTSFVISGMLLTVSETEVFLIFAALIAAGCLVIQRLRPRSDNGFGRKVWK